MSNDDTVIDFGDFQIRRRERAAMFDRSRCQHAHMELDDQGGIVKCTDCGASISPYWALSRMAERWERAQEKLRHRIDAHAEIVARDIHLVAAKKAEKAWRTKGMVPCCPHCGRGISAADGFGATMINKRFDERDRAKAAESKAAAAAHVADSPI